MGYPAGRSRCAQPFPPYNSLNMPFVAPQKQMEWQKKIKKAPSCEDAFFHNSKKELLGHATANNRESGHAETEESHRARLGNHGELGAEKVRGRL